MPWVAIGAAVIGGVIASDSASSAADAQSSSSSAALGEQGRQYDITRQDQAPWRGAGGAAVNRLSYLLGLGGPNGGGGALPPGLNEATLRDSIRAELLPRFTSQQTFSPGPDANPVTQRFVDEPGLSREIERVFGDRRLSAQYGAPTAQPSDGQAGSLSRHFSYQDFLNDPVTQASFQFGLDEGRKGLERRASAGGAYNSGATLKALTRFGSDYGSQKAGDSYNRYQTTQTNDYNRLANLAGLGQTAANQTAQAGMNYANNASNILTGQGNANAASQIAQGNAWNNTLGSVSNWWQQQQTLNRLGSGNQGGNGSQFGWAYGNGSLGD